MRNTRDFIPSLPCKAIDRTCVNKGFTLIELLVVISIIALLSSVVVASLSSARKKARDSNRIQNAKQISTALELYEQSNNTYKIQAAGLDNTGAGYVAKGSETAQYTNSVLSILKSSGFYNSATLKDPIYGTDNYYLGLCTSTNAYNVFLKVEQTDLQQSSTTIIQACDGTTANSLGFNYVSATVGGNSGGLADAVYGGGGGDSVTTTAQVLVVAGGGGGGDVTGAYPVGGGGAGGLVYNPVYNLVAGTYPITVGLGGNPGLANQSGFNGGNSIFSSITAIGGGGGARGTTGIVGLAGGSGGGGAYMASGGAGTAGQGYAGGNGGPESGGTGGAGGGAGGAAGTGSAVGPGLSYNISGASVVYARGGGGNNYTTGNGTDGLGYGGGCGTWISHYNGYKGGSGVVIVRYSTAYMDCTGGAITTSGSDTINTFTTNGSLVCTLK